QRAISLQAPPPALLGPRIAHRPECRHGTSARKSRYADEVEIRGQRLTLPPVVPADAERLGEILAPPEVARWWPAYDRARVEAEYLVDEADVTVFAIVLDGRLVGLIQASEEKAPELPPATLD